MTIDPRISERRRTVAEERARFDVRRVIWFLVVLGSLGLGFWLVTSPMLSVQTISIFGATHADVGEVLTEQQVVEGRPLIAIRSGSVAEAIEEDPWVRSAGVELVFPSHVEVTVEERVAVAWVPTGARWGLIADDGVLVRYADEPSSEAAPVQIRAEDPGLGSGVSEPEILGAVTFLQALPSELAAITVVRLTDQEMWAWVGDRNVRLGRPIDMAAKASALTAIIDSAPPGVIDVIAPTRPAIWADEEGSANPQPQDEGESESFTDG